jgi:hypothetical protein
MDLGFKVGIKKTNASSINMGSTEIGSTEIGSTQYRFSGFVSKVLKPSRVLKIYPVRDKDKKLITIDYWLFLIP